METHSRILAWRNPIDRGAWWATVHGGPKEWDPTEHAHVPHVYTRRGIHVNKRVLCVCLSLQSFQQNLEEWRETYSFLLSVTLN